MQLLEVSGAVRHIYIYIYIYVIRQLKVKSSCKLWTENVKETEPTANALC